MKYKFLIILLIVSTVFSACKKNAEEASVKEFELRFVEPSVDVPVEAGSTLWFNLLLSNHGSMVTEGEYYAMRYHGRLRIVEGEGHIINHNAYYVRYDKGRLGIELIIPALDQPVKYMLDIYKGNVIVASAPLSLSISLPEKGWIPKDIFGVDDIYEVKDEKIYSFNHLGFYESDIGLTSFKQQAGFALSSFGSIFLGMRGAKLYVFNSSAVYGSEPGTFMQSVGFEKLEFATMLNDKSMIVGWSDSALISDEQGLNWKRFNVPGKIHKVRQLADHSFVTWAKLAPFASELYSSVNATANAQPLNIPQDIVDMEVVGNVIYVLTRERLYRSVNKGASFEEMGATKDQWSDRLLTDGKHLIILSASTFYITANTESMQVMLEGRLPHDAYRVRVLSNKRLAALSSGYLFVLNY